jgi:hypothetical protein
MDPELVRLLTDPFGVAAVVFTVMALSRFLIAVFGPRPRSESTPEIAQGLHDLKHEVAQREEIRDTQIQKLDERVQRMEAQLRGGPYRARVPEPKGGVEIEPGITLHKRGGLRRRPV